MNNFDFYAPTRILFGRGEENRIGQLLAPHAKKILLHYGGGSVVRSGLLDRVKASLEKAGLFYVELGGVVPNPQLSKVYEGIELAKVNRVDFILAVGGGSVMDCAKVIAAAAKAPKDLSWHRPGDARGSTRHPVALAGQAAEKAHRPVIAYDSGHFSPA